MTDTYHCPKVKSHGRSERRFQWEQMANGDVRAMVYCLKCDPIQAIDEIAEPSLFADLLPPKPPSIRPML